MTPLAQALDLAERTGAAAHWARIEIHFRATVREEPPVNINIFGLRTPWSEPCPQKPVPQECGWAHSKA